jgi:hypothetical protein
VAEALEHGRDRVDLGGIGVEQEDVRVRQGE